MGRRAANVEDERCTIDGFDIERAARVALLAGLRSSSAMTTS
jgi:hypothetical protein